MALAVESVDQERAVFREEIIAAGLLVEGGVDGLYQRSGEFESIVRAVEGYVSRASVDSGPRLYFSPIMPRDVLERSDYVRSFPDLLGAIGVFRGADKEHAELLRALDEDRDWTEYLTSSEVALCSAACHPLYANLKGSVPEGGLHYEVQGYCFRHEPSLDPTRMQTFRQHEFVYIGEPENALAHRDRWLERGLGLLADLGLDVHSEEANDPFFGRAGRMLALNQRATALKFEIMCPVSSTEALTAITSANAHESHFGEAFDIVTADGEPAHSACIGFGLERITLALLRRHGMQSRRWEPSVRKLLWP